MRKKIIFFFIFISGVGFLTADNFIIKKAKRVVVSYKDQCLEAIGNCLKKSPVVISEIGSFLQTYGMMQNTLTHIVAAELDGKKHELSKCSNKKLKKIRDVTLEIDKCIVQLQHDLAQLSTQLNEYSLVLQDKQNSNDNKKMK